MIEWVYPIEQYVSGQNLRVSNASAHVTGKGLNVARALCALDHPVQAVFPGAGPLQRWGVDLLDQAQIPYTCLPSESDFRSGFLLVDSQGQRQSFYEQGPTYSTASREALMHRVQGLWEETPPSAVVLAGSLPPGIDGEFYQTLAHWLGERSVPVILDAVGHALIAALQAAPYMVKVNRTEYENTFQAKLDDEDDYARALLDLVERFDVQVAAITAGSGAAYFCVEGSVVRAFPPEVRVRNSVGSGDCLLAGWLAARARGANRASAIRTAMAAGTANAELLGVASINGARVRQLEKKIVLHEVC